MSLDGMLCSFLQGCGDKLVQFFKDNLLIIIATGLGIATFEVSNSKAHNIDFVWCLHNSLPSNAWNLGQYRFRWCLGTSWHKAITWTYHNFTDTHRIEIS